MIKITIEIEDKKEVIYVDSQHEIEHKSDLTKLPRGTIITKKKGFKPVDQARTVNKKSKICARCGKTFEASGPAQKYCSEQCGLKHKSEKEKIKILEKRKGILKVNSKAKICRTCKKEFTNYTSNSQLYCSDECKNGGIIVTHKDDPITEPDMDKPIEPEIPKHDDNPNIITKIKDKIFPKKRDNIVDQPGEMNLKTITKEQIERSKDHPYSLDR